MAQFAGNLDTYLRVLYDYKYKSHDGADIQIKLGEECLLLKKTTPEWWYVLKQGDRKPIYVPSNYVEEIHKTVINLDGSTGEENKPQAQKPAKKGPPPQVPKKKKIPPKAPPKPSKLIRKPSVEDEVLKELDNILEHAFDGEPIIEEEEPAEATSSGEGAQRDSNLSSTASSISSDKRLSSTYSNPSSKTNSLNRDAALVRKPSDSDIKSEASENEDSKRDSVFTSNGPASPLEPEPDYADSGDNLSPTSEKSPSPPTVSNVDSSKDPGDSGISEGSTECLDKKGSIESSESKEEAEEPNTGDSLEQDIPLDEKLHASCNDELPDYENFNYVKENVLRDSKTEELSDLPDYANLSDIQARIFAEPPPSNPPPGAAPVRTIDEWEEHKDHVTGRSYFFNTVARDSTWQPPYCFTLRKKGMAPRQARDSCKRVASFTNTFGTPIDLDPVAEGHGNSSFDSEDFAAYSEAVGLGSEGQRGSSGGGSLWARLMQAAKDPERSSIVMSQPVVNLPRGWTEERREDGTMMYVNQHTKEKWRSSVSPSGKTYFYNEKTGDSLWELPEVRSLRPVSMLGSPRTNSPRVQRRHMATASPQSSRMSWAPGDAVASPRMRAWGSGLPVTNPPPHALAAAPEEQEETRDEVPEMNSANHSEEPDLTSLMRRRKQRAKTAPTLFEDSKQQQEFLAKHAESARRGSAQTPNRRTVEEVRGSLRRCKLMEHGKKLKASWSEVYAVLSAGRLRFYKNQKAANPKSGPPRPEMELELAGSVLEVGTKDKKEKTRKNVLSLMTAYESEFLLQFDKEQDRNTWHEALQSHIHPTHDDLILINSTIRESQPAQDSNSLDRKKHKPGSAVTNDYPTLSTASTMSSDDFSAERASRVRNFLFKWLAKRPSELSLRERGIIKDAVFGNHLHRVCDRDQCNVPHFVTKVIAAIEKRGLKTDGIYRVSGNMAEIQKLRLLVDSGAAYNLDSSFEWETHVLTGALKLFFRELKEPLVPFVFYAKLLNANQVERAGRVRAFRDLVKQMPPSNRETLRDLMRHLNKVVQQSAHNRMQTQNLAIVFGPTLMWPEHDTTHVAVSMVQSGQIIEYMIQEQHKLFL